MALGVPLAGGQYSLQSALILKTPQHFHLLVIFQPARSRFKGLKLWLHFYISLLSPIKSMWPVLDTEMKLNICVQSRTCHFPNQG